MGVGSLSHTMDPATGGRVAHICMTSANVGLIEKPRSGHPAVDAKRCNMVQVGVG